MNLSQMISLKMFLLTAMLLFAADSSAQAATLIVTKIADTNDNVCNADCSLREAVFVANNSPDNDVIEFSPTAFANPQTVTLTLGELTVTGNGTLTVNGTGANRLAISGNDQSRVFFVGTSANLTLTGITVTGGRVTGSSGGGGIFNNAGTLLINNSTISGNSAIGGGNGSNNGGGIFNIGGNVSLTNSTVSGNSASGDSSNIGGGISNIQGTLTITNSTISGNFATGGEVNAGGGIDNSSGTVNARNTIISGNTAENNPDLLGSLNININNLIGGNALLAPLGFYGGQTQTHALLSGSPAINAGTSTNAPLTDQRGAARVGAVDIGAFELNNSAAGGNFTATLPTGKQNNPYAALITANRGTFIYSVSAGTLPTGLALTSNPPVNGMVELTGTPTQSGSFNFTVTASDGMNSVVTDYTLVIQPLITTTSGLTSSLNPSVIGQPVTFTVTVTPTGGGTPSGTMQFLDGGNQIEGCESVMLSSGQAQCQTTALSVGSHTITAQYSGDINFDESTGSLTTNPQVVLNTLSITDVSIAEGALGTRQMTFTVTLGGLSASATSVHYQTANNTATTPGDYTAVPDTALNIPSNTPSATITVAVKGDTLFEGNETFFVNLLTPSTNAVISDNQALATIADDEPQTADLSGDGLTDAALWNSNNGNWLVRNSNSGAVTLAANDWGLASLGDIAVPGDYDFDNKIDLAVFRPSEGNWYILQSTTGAPAVQYWGQTGDVPVPGDYDADGRTDLAVYRPSEGKWYVKKSGGGVIVQNWGLSTDKPVVGDYDGDGKSDLAVFRPAEGNWYILNSSTGTITIANWGLSTDKLVEGDYDGDGKTDMAVYRSGTWFIKQSSGGSVVKSWGDATDLPIPGDYDGDGRFDIGVWRSSEGNFYVINSATNTVNLQTIEVGGAGIVPVANASLPH